MSNLRWKEGGGGGRKGGGRKRGSRGERRKRKEQRCGRGRGKERSVLSSAKFWQQTCSSQTFAVLQKPCCRLNTPATGDNPRSAELSGTPRSETGSHHGCTWSSGRGTKLVALPLPCAGLGQRGKGGMEGREQRGGTTRGACITFWITVPNLFFFK